MKFLAERHLGKPNSPARMGRHNFWVVKFNNNDENNCLVETFLNRAAIYIFTFIFVMTCPAVQFWLLENELNRLSALWGVCVRACIFFLGGGGGGGGVVFKQGDVDIYLNVHWTYVYQCLDIYSYFSTKFPNFSFWYSLCTISGGIFLWDFKHSSSFDAKA